MGAPKQDLASSISDSSELGLSVRVLAGNDHEACRWARELGQTLSGLLTLDIDARIASSSFSAGESQVLFIDAETPELEATLAGLDRKGQAVFLIVREGATVPAALVEGLVDDVLIHPFRPLEVLGKLRQYQRIVELREAAELNVCYAQVVERLQSNLQLAERLQKSKLPLRFPEVRGFKVTSRYLAGIRSGGDFADLAETQDGQQFAIVLTDASSYRLSGAVLDVLSRVMTRIPLEESRSCITSARRIRDGVLETLTEKDQLSLFYAVMSRKDYRLRFLNLGSTRAFYASPGKGFRELDVHGGALVRAHSVRNESEGELVLEPEGRLALVTDGFVEAAGGAAPLKEILDRFRSNAAADSLNEMAFRVKNAFNDPEDMPARDCTAVIFDVDSRLIRLA